MKYYIKFGVVFIILLALFITCCSKHEREKSKKINNVRTNKANREEVIGELQSLEAKALEYYEGKNGKEQSRTVQTEEELAKSLGWTSYTDSTDAVIDTTSCAPKATSPEVIDN